MKKKEKISFILFAFSSIGFFIAAAINCVSEEHSGGAYVCLGFCFLCLALEHYNKYKDKKEEKK